MKHHLMNKPFLIVGLALACAALACSMPGAADGGTPTPAVAEGLTNTPYVVTATPDAAVVTATPDASGGTTGGSTIGGSTTGSTTGGSTGGTDCLYDSLYIADLTIPDGTELNTGSAFTKTWRIKNNGCAAWPTGTTLIFVGGDQMGGPASVPVPQTVAGGTQDISVNLTAPGGVGDVQGKWQLRSADGIQFGDQISVKIKTVAPPPAPGVTPTFHIYIPPGGFQLLATNTPIFLVPLLLSDYTANYVGTGCSLFGTAYMAKVKNTGTTTFQSEYVKLSVPSASYSNDGQSNEGFANGTTCSATVSSSLAPGDSAYVLGAMLSGPSSGQAGKMTIKLCTADNLGGTCVTKVLDFNVE